MCVCGYAWCEFCLLAQLIMFSDVNKSHHSRTWVWCSGMLEQASLSLMACYHLTFVSVSFPVPRWFSISLLAQSETQHRLNFHCHWWGAWIQTLQGTAEECTAGEKLALGYCMQDSLPLISQMSQIMTYFTVHYSEWMSKTFLRIFCGSREEILS